MASFSVGGPVRSSGEWQPMLPARFWTKKSFTVRRELLVDLDIRVSSRRGISIVGTETHRVSWRATFRRLAKR